MRRFLTAARMIEGTTTLITGSEANHIGNVLRLRTGDEIILSDGKGEEYEARIIAFVPGGVRALILRKIESSSESGAEITIAQAFLKEKKMDDLIRPLTELGISRWIPFMSERSVARPDPERLKTRHERWEVIARESVKQCRRAKTPEISPVSSFEQVLAAGKDCDAKLVFWENASDAIPVRGRKIIALLGPEGGFRESEIEMARKSGFIPVTLGPRILKAETATIAVSALLQYIFGDMGKKKA